jgi:hypothetical protein
LNKTAKTLQFLKKYAGKVPKTAAANGRFAERRRIFATKKHAVTVSIFTVLRFFVSAFSALFIPPSVLSFIPFYAAVTYIKKRGRGSDCGKLLVEISVNKDASSPPRIFYRRIR